MPALKKSVLNATVLISALGYFVDIYDLLLFSIVRVPSLRSMNVADGELMAQGVKLINFQMSGMLIGGVLWGIVGDKKGRLSVLFGSIFLYSVANIANAFVSNVDVYAALRFLAGVGLAGELGAAITLVSEVMTEESRGYGTSVVAGVGIMGAVFAALVGDFFSWRTAYVVGGVMGLVLLVLRISMFESGMYESARQSHVRKGDLRMLLGSASRLTRYLRCILIGIPLWFVVGVLMTFAPELARALGVLGEVSAGKAILWGYLGISIGDFISGFLSQILRSRKKVLLGSLLSCLSLMLVYILGRGFSVTEFYLLCFSLGLACGYWAVFMTVAAEQFGTNLRATVTTTTPNFVRGAVVPLTLALQALHSRMGILESAATVGLCSFAVAFLALWGMDETYGKNLDYFES